MQQRSLFSINGTLYQESEAVIPATDRGLRFGDGIFETILIHNARPYLWKEHMQRMQDGIHTLGIEYNHDISVLHRNLNTLILAHGEKNALARIIITRGCGSQGYLPTKGIKPNIIMEICPLPNFPNTFTVYQSNYTKISSKSLPTQYKTLQGLNSTLARIEADAHGYDEAILLNSEGYVSELSSGNIFWIRGERLHTPSMECDILSGTMRHAIKRLSPFQIIECKARITDIFDADCAFGTNSIWKCIPIRKINEHMIGSIEHPVITMLNDLIEEDIARETA